MGRKQDGLKAEDGIRDAQESRGLGDVYKRQSPGCPTLEGEGVNRVAKCFLT